VKREPHRGYLPYGLESICASCGMEFGDHKSKVPYVLRMIVKNELIKCTGFIPKKKSFFESPIINIPLPPLNGCKGLCNHIYCDLLKRAEGENLEN
jgi:hypothetical protein